MHLIEKNTAKECIRVLKTIIRTENECYCKASAFKLLYHLEHEPRKYLPKVSPGFLLELLFLLKGANGQAGFPRYSPPKFLSLSDRDAALERCIELDRYASVIERYYERYGCGLEKGIIEKRGAVKAKILAYFKGSEADWQDYRWQIKHVITTLKPLEKLISLTGAEKAGLRLAEEQKVPFHITPYYLSLMNPDSRKGFGRSIRAQVFPSEEYVRQVSYAKKHGQCMDFMGEASTSPIDCITRRYPQILILKPYNACPQICVYCQRNWEIKSLSEGDVASSKVQEAIAWIAQNRHISEVLVTGGDPLTLGNGYIGRLIDKLSKIRHIERIRIGTRILVTNPFRIDGGLLDIFRKHHAIGKKEICIVTHVQHPTEITPELVESVRKIRECSIKVYNQQVFTYYNSKKFETCSLRRWLKVSGIDPYYSFNMKGKQETIDFRVPIARIEQERKEEARLLPGLERTDEPVFNVPKLGKVHLRAWQDHEPIMILPDGSRIYRFYPWDSKLELTSPYDYTDVPIYDYLMRLNADGDDVDDYQTIWYYF
jgi:lysine 2,3-aminomutase